MKKLKLRLLALQYELELKQNDKSHLKDYIAANVMVARLKEFPVLRDGNESLGMLIFPFNTELPKTYEVPTISKLEYILARQKGKKSIDSADECAAATWLKLMIENGFITEGQVVDISQYKLIDCLY